eukprot:81261-Pyramimonas_sp.AAC.1
MRRDPTPCTIGLLKQGTIKKGTKPCLAPKAPPYTSGPRGISMECPDEHRAPSEPKLLFISAS